MHRAGEIFGIKPLALHAIGQLLTCLRHHFHQRQAIAALQGRAQGIGEPFLNALPRHQTIHHHFDVVGVVLIQFDVVGEFPHLAIDPHPGKTLRHQAPQQLHMGALLAPHHRRQQLIADPFRQRHNLVHHLIDGLGSDRAIALGAVGFTGAAEEQAQVILDFRHRAHGGAWVVAGGFLVDRNGWR